MSKLTRAAQLVPALVAIALLITSSGQGARTGGLELRQDGNRIVAAGEVGAGFLGSDVALSADGNTALVGAPYDNGLNGAAWVFVRSDSAWSQLGDKLTGGQNAPRLFGWSVALSADGTTALIGGISDSGQKGAAWVFTRSGSSWTQQAKLVALDEALDGEFGYSVALSADGNIALIGGDTDRWGGGMTQNGAAWIFGRSGSTWTQLGPKLTGGGGQGSRFGASVALSADGSTALVGGPADPGTGVGAAWVFSRYSATGWGQQGPKLIGSGAGTFGWSVALSADGATALIGGEGKSAAWVFTRSGSTWTQQGPVLTPSDPIGGSLFGWDVALSADGDTALVGGKINGSGRGAMWSFARSGETWAQQGARIEAGGEVGSGEFGAAVDLADDGNSAFVGGPKHDGNLGAVWPFVSRPGVLSLAPDSGPTAGGTQVTVSGSDFKNAGSVRFGSTPATSFTVVSPTVIKAVSPSHGAGAVDVTVSNSGGTSAVTGNSLFRYAAPAGTPPPPPPPPPPSPGSRDTQAPTTPGTFRGRYTLGKLVLRWAASKDNIGVDRYQLSSNGKLIRRLPPVATSTVLRNFGKRRTFVFTLSAFDAAGNGSVPARLKVVPRRRPAGIPASIPGWAQKLFAWETGGRKGVSPFVPKPLPAWYARWKAWRLQPYKITP
jgi:IPT/TIG domain/FG-GAP repeat